MNAQRPGTVGRLTRGAPALAVALAAAVAVGMPASAAAHEGQARAPGAGHQAAAGVISTVAGGVGGPEVGTKVAINSCGVAFSDGHLYISDSTVPGARSPVGAVRMMSPGSGVLSTFVAGTYLHHGRLGDGGPATKASMAPCALAAGTSGNLVISDDQHTRIRVIAGSFGSFYGQQMTTGHIYTVASGFGGDVAVDRAGNLVLTGDQRIQVVANRGGTFYGQQMAAGHIYTVAGTGLSGFSGDGGPATSATFDDPSGVAVDPAGNLVIADARNYRVRVVAEKTGTFYGMAMTAGDIYTVAGDGSEQFYGNGIPATSAGMQPLSVAVDAAGNVLISDRTYHLRVVTDSTGTFYGQKMTAGYIYTLAGNGNGGPSGGGGPATSAALYPIAATVDAAGNVVIADGHHLVWVVAATTGTFYGRKMTAEHIYPIAGTGHGRGFSGDGGPATAAELAEPARVAVDPAGNVLLGDNANYRVRMVAARAGTFFGRKVAAGDIYTVAGNGHPGSSGDGGPATRAKLLGPLAVAVDHAGNLVIADTNGELVRVVAGSTGTFYGVAMTAGYIYTVAGNGQRGFSGDYGPATGAELSIPLGVAVDPAGNLLIADTGNGRVRVVAGRSGTFYGIKMTRGDIYTVAGNGSSGFSGDGGPAVKAAVDPVGLTVDPAGNLVIGDAGNERVRVVAGRNGTFYGIKMTADDIYTVAGDGDQGFSGDGGPATGAAFYDPNGIAVDPAGNLVIADAGNARVRVVAESTGSFYGVAMTGGDIYTVAGDGSTAFSGDGGPATAAGVGTADVAVDAGGNLVIADETNNRLRMVTG